LIEIYRVRNLLSYTNVKTWSCYDVVENTQYRGVGICHRESIEKKLYKENIHNLLLQEVPLE